MLTHRDPGTWWGFCEDYILIVFCDLGAASLLSMLGYVLRSGGKDLPLLVPACFRRLRNQKQVLVGAHGPADLAH